LKNQEVDISILLEQCKLNNQKAMLAVYNKYYKAMFNVAFRIVNNYELAEDIMQESFLNAFDKLKSFSGSVTFGSWLKRIVINKSITELHKTTKYKFESIDENFDTSETFETTDLDLKDKKVEHVLEKLNELKPNYKIILTLFYIEGFDTEEITEILKITDNNCRTMLSRAKESLKNKFQKNELQRQ
jgi:RNA polymerase sigma factor (sigma-70 family)